MIARENVDENANGTLSVHPFIFNWRGQIENCERLESLLRKDYPNLTIINSDPDNERSHWINIGDDAYYTAQLLEAISRKDGDMVFLVQADAWHPELPAIVDRARCLMETNSIGVYAPNVDFTTHTYRKEELKRFVDSCFHVPLTDDTCWAIRSTVLDRTVFTSADLNRYGFGMDVAIYATSRLMNLAVVRDYQWTVAHPQSRGYSTQRAVDEMNAFFGTLPMGLGREVSAILAESAALGGVVGAK